MQNDHDLLAQVPLFANLPPDEITRLASSLRVVDLESTQTLFKEGDPGDHLYIIRAGELDIIKAADTPAARLIATRGPGEFVGEMSLFNLDGRRTATVRAHKLAQLWQMSRAEFDALLKRHPLLAYAIVQVLSLRLTKAQDIALDELREKNRQLAAAYEELKAAQSQIIEKEKLERELQVAARIQMSILPRAMPLLAGFEFGARLIPARSVGGDWWDFIPLDRHQVGVVIGDVADKGMPAAIFMAQCHALMRAEASHARSPEQTLQRVNSLLLEMNAEGLFATVVYGILDSAGSTFTYARAGHDSPIYASPKGAINPLPLGPSLVLGSFRNPRLDLHTITLSPGSFLLLYTDGVVEAKSPSGDFFDMARLLEVLSSDPNSTAQEICDHVWDAVRAFQDTAIQFDDVTMLAIRTTPAKQDKP
jgi:serine phosphatase RsbU (regulator of sigma subunit)